MEVSSEAPSDASSGGVGPAETATPLLFHSLLGHNDESRSFPGRRRKLAGRGGTAQMQ